MICMADVAEGESAEANKGARRLKRERLLRSACATHRHNYVNCVGGGGADRHLFALWVFVSNSNNHKKMSTLIGEGAQIYSDIF